LASFFRKIGDVGVESGDDVEVDSGAVAESRDTAWYGSPPVLSRSRVDDRYLDPE
jgi:hypothetical protein